jgi:D-amino-acid dehydrogenase
MVSKAIRWMADPESPFFVRPRLDPDLIAWGWHFWRAGTATRADAAGPTLRDLSNQSREMYADLAAETGNEFELVTAGLLNLVRTPSGLRAEEHAAARARALGVPAEMLDARGVAALEPDVAFDAIGGAYYPTDAHMTPAKMMAVLERRVAERGAAFAWNAEIRGWRTEGRSVRAAKTDAGEIAADEFVLAAGSWTPRLAAPLGVSLRMQPGKGYSVTLPPPHPRLRRSAILHEARVALTPMGDTLRVGGTMELAGYDLVISPPRLRGIAKSLRRYLPEVGESAFDGVKPWCGLRPCTPDGLPYVGRVERYENLSVASGHAMMGISMAPATGRLLAQLLDGEPPSTDPKPLRPGRYG